MFKQKSLFTLRHPYLQACKQGWVRSTLPSPPHFFRNSVMKNLLIYIVSFQIFRTSRPAVKEECFAPQTEEEKHESEGKIRNYSKIFKFPSNFKDICRNLITLCNDLLNMCFKTLKLQKTFKFELTFFYNKPKKYEKINFSQKRF